MANADNNVVNAKDVMNAKDQKHHKNHKHTKDTKESDIIKLNVGGIIYVTTKTTLCQPGSYFEMMFSGKMEPGIQIDGAYFIDRNGHIFEYILDYMRNLDQWIPPTKIDTLSKLVNEACFFCLEGMIERIKGAIPIERYAFQINIQENSKGLVTEIGYSSPPPYIEAYIDSLTVSKTSSKVDPPILGFVAKLLCKLDKKYKLCYQSLVDLDGNSTLVFIADPQQTALHQIQKHIGLLNT